MFLGELEGGVILRVLLKEWPLGLLEGPVFGVILGTVAWVEEDNCVLGAVAGVVLLLNMMLASLAGVALPLMARRMHLDPAIVAGVFNTMLTGLFGFLIYLGLATLFISELVWCRLQSSMVLSSH